MTHKGQSQKWSSPKVKFQIACLRENGHGLYRVVTEVHESKKKLPKVASLPRYKQL